MPNDPADPTARGRVWQGIGGWAAAPVTGEAPSPAGAAPSPGSAAPRDISSDPGVVQIVQALAALPLALPWVVPPVDSRVFEVPQLNIPINVNPGVTVVLGEFSVPQGYEGRVTVFGCAGSDVANLRWSIVVRGRPVAPIAGLVLQYGLITTPTVIPGGGIRLIPSDDVLLQVSNIGAGIIAGVQGRMGGYLWRLG